MLNIGICITSAIVSVTRSNLWWAFSCWDDCFEKSSKCTVAKKKCFH